MDNANILIEIKNLKKYFYKDVGICHKNIQTLKAVDDVSFCIKKGETLGLVGESGCGKTTIGRTIMRLYEPTSGEIIYDGVDVTKLGATAFMPYRKKMQMIFQDPYASLDPRMTVADIIGEPMDIHCLCSRKERQDRIYGLLNIVGLRKNHASRYPHEFSGGQRQRIGIARALSAMPEFIICDEPISALDVSIQAQVVNMLEDLQQEKGLTYLFIAHDLSMVRHISDRVSVMYLGSIMEIATSAELYRNPIHPYTQALLSSIPVPNPRVKKDRIILEGEVPSPLDPPSGCKFRTRCRYAKPLCAESVPDLKDLGGEHFVACHLF